MFTTLRTTVTNDLDFFVEIICRTPLWIVTVLSAGSAAVSSDIAVFVVLRGWGLVGPRPSLTWRRMRIFVLAKPCFEFILFFE